MSNNLNDISKIYLDQVYSIKKKEVSDDVEDNSAEESEATVVSEVLEKLGYEVDSEYSDTADGLAEMTKDVASQMADDRIDQVLENFPLVKEHLQYVLNGGQSQDFMQVHDPGMDYNQIEFDGDNYYWRI